MWSKPYTTRPRETAMPAETANLLRDEAIRALRGYVATGMLGFLWKGLDRARVLGVAIPPNASIGKPTAVENVIMALITQ